MLSGILTKIGDLPDISITSLRGILTHEEYKYYSDNLDALYAIIDQAEESNVSPSEYITIQGWQKEAVLGAKMLNDKLREDYVDGMYRKALENEYIQSMENLVSHPLNFQYLTKPNDASELKNLEKDITGKLGKKVTDYSDIGNMLSWSFMSQLRHNFIAGKQNIGIAAVGQTNHAQNQRGVIYIDTDRLGTKKKIMTLMRKLY